MYFLFTDETNRVANDEVKFFIYGGVIIPADSFPALHQRVSLARHQMGLLATEELKFETRSRTRRFNEAHPDAAARHALAKSRVLDACASLGVKFLACAVLHDIARSRGQEELVTWGMNVVIGGFDRFLTSEGDHGVCLIDNFPFPRGDRVIREKFQRGLTFRDRDDIALPRILSYGFTTSGASHASAVTDIVLGGFRFCVNGREDHPAVCDIFPRIHSLLWSRQYGTGRRILDYGLRLMPKVPAAVHRVEYTALRDKLNRMASRIQLGNS